MKLSFRYIVIFFGVIGMVMFAGCDTDTKSFSMVDSALAKNINQLKKEPGITETGFASDRDKKLFKLGIRIDYKQITAEGLKRAIESYLNSSASSVGEPNSKELLKPYNFQIEEIDQDNNTRIIAVKTQDSTEIIWK